MEVVDPKRLDILFLQETHTIPSDEVDCGSWWEGSCFLSHSTNLSAWVAMLFRTAANATVLPVTEVVKGRLLMTRA